jgi:hypothetical protein
MLRDAGILEARKVGKEVHYSVRYSALAESLRQIADAIDACCPAESTNAKKKTQRRATNVQLEKLGES